MLDSKWNVSPKTARWTVSQVPEKRWTRSNVNQPTCEKYLNIKSSSLIKVSSTASMVSFTELEQEIYVEVNSLDSQSNVLTPEKTLNESSYKTNTTFL